MKLSPGFHGALMLKYSVINHRPANSEFKISVRIFVFVVCLMNIIFVH